MRYPIPAKPERLERDDCEYKRNGTVNLEPVCLPRRPSALASSQKPAPAKAGVTDRRTNIDFAECMRELVDIHYPDAPLIRVVMDNLSTHSAGALYDAFPASEAHRILKRFEFHHTPQACQLAQHVRN